MGSVITLTTDFGTQDPYVGAMKGIILGINPEATIVDITHSIEPQNILQSAFILSTAHHYFPEGAIHIVVVDPGVGGRRRAVLLKTPLAYFVAPDNGVLSYVMADSPFEAISLTEPRFWRHPVSATFHGRDIFAPVAAHLSLGVPHREFGESITSLITLSLPKPQTSPDGALVGHIVHIDRFGNLITDIIGELIGNDVSIEVLGHKIEGLSSCYAEGGELLALIGSSGFLEIAAKDGSAAKLLGAKVGDEVRARA